MINQIRNIFELLKFAFKHRKEIAKLKDELWELKTLHSEAIHDKKFERHEVLDLLKQTDKILDTLIYIVEND